MIIIGKSLQIREVERLAQSAVKFRLPLLVTGEVGVGKSFIHDWVEERRGPLDTIHDFSKAVSIYIPPLRERREDIYLLADYFFNEDMTYTFNKNIPDEIKKQFDSYDWPGNVRELKHKVLALRSGCSFGPLPSLRLRRDNNEII